LRENGKGYVEDERLLPLSEGDSLPSGNLVGRIQIKGETSKTQKIY